ncbi:MAG: radical SAM family heme chaperone HemW [Rhodobacter sp.]|nr:radical SAM family heme chaperone HemW [Rhodobacter sp.]
MRSGNWSRPVLPENWQAAGFGLYIHWPFCQAKCPYCDFNSHVAVAVDQAGWRDAFLSEIGRVGGVTGDRVLESVYFGGGTPSLMEPSLVSALLETVSETWTLADDIEITLEANPTSVEARRFRGYRSAGVNRVSIGVQALNDSDLRALGRLHSSAESLAAVDVAQATFDRMSFDLIYARQNQSLQDWMAELGQALSIAGDHLSLYQLTIEEGTAFGDRHARGRLPGLPDEELSADMYLATQEMCATAGLPAYEVSNHAKLGAESRHNLTYWRGGDYIGIGPGAHGRLTLDGIRYATETELSPMRWRRAVESTGTGESIRYAIPAGDQVSEQVLMGLRTREGVALDRLAEPHIRSTLTDNSSELVELGLVTLCGDRLAVTDRGRPVLNAITERLLAT